MEITSNLLLEIAIYWVRFRIFSFVRKIRSCKKCLRWGHSDFNCRGKVRTKIRSNIPANKVDANGDYASVECINCGRERGHRSADTNCLSCQKYKLINKVMAYCNTNYFTAKRLIKQKNITDLADVEFKCKSHAYLAWNKDLLDFNSD